MMLMVDVSHDHDDVNSEHDHDDHNGDHDEDHDVDVSHDVNHDHDDHITSDMRIHFEAK